MNSDLPKVLHPLQGRPLMLHVINNLREAGVEDIVTVVGYKGESVVAILPSGVRHVWQHEQLGTGHAVMQAEQALDNFKGQVLIACGDVPLIRPVTFKRLIEESLTENTGAAVLTMNLEIPTGYGRIVKDKNGFFQKIVEEKDASPEERQISEVNTGTYVFNKDFLFAGLKELKTDNAQKEYYLTDALRYIVESGFNVKTVFLEDSIEGCGINAQDELLSLETLLKAKANHV